MGPTVRTPRLAGRLRWQPQRPDWHAILTLQRPRRAQLRTRVLAGVLAVTVIALVAFDFAAVGALRRYLLGHTDAQLQTVLALYRPMTITRPPNGNWVFEAQPACGSATGCAASRSGRRRTCSRRPGAAAGTAAGPARRAGDRPDHGSRFRHRSWRSSGSGSSAGDAHVSSSAGTPAWSRASPLVQMLHLLAANHGARTVTSAAGDVTLRLGAIQVNLAASSTPPPASAT